MKFDLKKPCAACPFRKDAVPSWLGNYTPQGVVDSIKADQPFFCHHDVENKIGYDDPDWQEKAMESAQHCAGALIFARKMCKLSRDPEIAEGQRKINPNQDILFPPEQFVEYHSVTISAAAKKIKERVKKSKK
jgi:hypothetical protein